jgi:hypothetical protein
MIGKCPNCGIGLKEPPFTNRETNEVVITLKYRSFIDNNKTLYSVEKKGYCDICNAKINDLKKQIILMKNKPIS